MQHPRTQPELARKAAGFGQGSSQPEGTAPLLAEPQVGSPAGS